MRIPKVTKLGPKAKGPYKFSRYLGKDRLTAELVDPNRVDKLKINGKTYQCARTFVESTSNLAKTLVPWEYYEFSPEELEEE